MKGKEASFMPNSNAVHSSRDGQNNRVDYFTEILKKTGRLNHSIAVGDICAIRDPEGTKAVPLENEQWIIGQVLVLFIRRESLDKSTFHVRVRRLARWKGEGENFANKKELKSFEQRGFFRPEQALLETIRVETHPLKNIFPVDIHIIDSKELLTEDRAKTSFDAVTQSHELKLSCPARIDKNDVLHDARKDWKSYQKQRTESSDPPYVLRSGWELMQEDLQLIEALKKAWTRRSTNVFSVDAPSTGKENKRTREGSQRKSILGNKKIKRSSQSVQFAPGTKPSSRSRLSKQADDAVSDYSNDASSVQDSTNFRDTVSQASSDALMSMSVESTSRHPTPFGTVYKTQKKAREKAGYETTYVEAVEMDVEKEAVAVGLRNKLVEPRWQVRVGDIIILQCEGTGPPNKSFFAGKSKWYPFTVPWSVAQVVAIYYSNNDEEEMKMEVRWFYRPDELDLEAKKAMSSKQRTELLSGLFHSRQLVEIDEHITEAPVESALGLARMTSEANPSKDWFRLHVHPSVLEIGFICRFMYFFKNDDSQLHAVGDWTNYGALSSAPLYRGLKCPKCKPGKDTKLFKRYQERLCRRFRIPELTASVVDDDYAEETISFLEWASGEMDCARATCSAADAYYTSQHFEFFSSIRIEIVKDRCDARSMAKKSENQEIEVAVGELVCIACGVERANRQDRKTEKMWSPFKGPFTYAQVLTIYRNVAESESPLLLEIRHFHRRKEVNHVSEIYLPRSCAREDEEDVYESFETEVISAGRVLGVADLYLGLHTEKFNMSSMGLVSSRSGMLRPKCRCAYYCTKSAVQPIFCADSSSRKWSRRLMERGLSASRMIQEDSNLESSVEFCLGITISARFSEEKGMFQSLVPEAKCASDPTPLCSKQIDAEEVFFFPKATADIPWSSFEDENHLCPSRDRNDCSWTVCVGQIVAIRSDQVPSDSFYKHGWEPAQILAIQGNNDDLKKMKYHFKVRTLRRCLKLAALNSFPGRLSESDEMLIKTVHASSLLGPVYVATEKGVPFVWESVLRFLPANVLVYEGSRPFDFSAFVMRGLEMSSCYSSSELARLYDSLERELPGFSKVQKSCQDEVVIETAQTLMEPVPRGQLYSDTNGTTYYSRVVVEPSMESFSEDIWESKKRVDAPWNVEIGDSVAVHCQHGCGPAKFGRAFQNSEKVGKYGITKEPFGYCEVVAIFVASPEDNEDGESSQVELEIRWLYRVPEINRSASSTYNEDFTNDCEEVFESDHYDIIPASALYFPIIIHDTKFPLGQRKFHLGLPVVELSCYRFWSTKRQSLVSVQSSEEARLLRCRTNSPLLQQDAGLRKAMGIAASSSMDTSLAVKGDWKSSFRDVIQKLSLTDASKEGFKSTKAIVGREREMKDILSFLRHALKASIKEGHRSLFIAGPPGVGKTACVRAAISELEQLRANGTVPAFEFVSMNGMEMRFPFEAYVHLWEKISGKAMGPDQAADRLEAYFTKDQSLAAREAISCSKSVVVLLDEIDYLVTKNQSVLYNFFDWPTHNQDRRLIVLGVSNTLNLAEQLHTRVQSRIGGRRCIFKAYDADQIQKILRSKLLQASPGYTVFDEDAIKFVSKKTASLSGDIRRAFQICRTAAEHVMREQSDSPKDPIVTIRDAVKVSRESFYSAKSQAITRCTAFEALLLVTLASLSKSTGREFGGFDLEEVLVKMDALANGLGDLRYLPTPTLGECLGLVARLAEGNIVSTVTPKTTSLTYRASLAGCGGPWPLVSLTVDDLSVLLALKKSPHQALAQKYLGLKGL